MMRISLWIISCVLCFALGIWTGFRLSRPAEDHRKEDAVVMLNSMKDVLKVTTVEAEISELLTQQSYYWIDISPFRKSAIVRVRATVHAGFDLDSSALQIDEASHRVILRIPSEPQILSVDQKLDYYDLKQGSFNAFTGEELTLLQDKARDLILRSAIKGGVLDRARKRRADILLSLQAMAAASGYEVKTEKMPDPPSGLRG